MRFAVLFALLCVACSASADTRSKLIEAIRNNRDAAAKEVATLKGELQAMKAGRVVRGVEQPVQRLELPNGKVRYGYRSPKDKEEAVASMEGRIARATNRDALLPVLSMVGKVGDVGQFPTSGVVHTDASGRMVTYAFKARQIVGPDQVLVDWEMRDMSTVRPATRPDHSSLVWLHLDTSDMADGQSVPLAGVWEVVGNKTYTTAAGGSNTVYEYRPVDMAGVFDEAIKD